MDIAEVMQARKELQMAQQDFMLADTEFIDVAIHRLNAAEQGKSVEGGKAGGDVFDSFYRCNYVQQR